MGGAAGHMNHPFDLSWVNDGNDLLDFFERAKLYVDKAGAGSVKIDGVNFNPIFQHWKISDDKSVNYIANFKKN